MEHLVLHAGDPFGDVSFYIEDGRVALIHMGAHGGTKSAPEQWNAALRGAMLGGAEFPLPLDFSALPPVRLAAMEAARRIPPGSTATYGDLAAAIGRPRAARAVGSAMSNNPFTLIVPCHRVVPKSGGIGSYGAGGPLMKARLLRWEQEEMARLGER